MRIKLTMMAIGLLLIQGAGSSLALSPAEEVVYVWTAELSPVTLKGLKALDTNLVETAVHYPDATTFSFRLGQVDLSVGGRTGEFWEKRADQVGRHILTSATNQMFLAVRTRVEQTRHPKLIQIIAHPRLDGPSRRFVCAVAKLTEGFVIVDISELGNGTTKIYDHSGRLLNGTSVNENFIGTNTTGTVANQPSDRTR